MDLDDLTDSVRSVLTPRRRFYEYRHANAYAADAQWLVNELQELADSGTLPLLRLVERALALTVRTILRSDDSSGLQGDQINALLEVHARIARRIAPTLDAKERRRLATWIHRFRFDDQQDFFDPDVAQYADALGPDGIELYRDLVEESARAGEDPYGVQYARERLAVLTREPAAIVASHGGEPKAQFHAIRLVRALDDAGLRRHAVTYAERGLALPVTHRHGVLVERLVQDATERGADEEILALRKEHLRRAPDIGAFLALRTAAQRSGVWEDLRADAEAYLARHRDFQWIGHLLSEGRDDEAWDFARSSPGAATAAQVWPTLCERRARTAPAETLPRYEQLVTDTLASADKRAYRSAAELLVAMRGAARAAGLTDRYAEFAARTVEEHRRRPTLLRILQQRGVIGEDRTIL